MGLLRSVAKGAASQAGRELVKEGVRQHTANVLKEKLRIPAIIAVALLLVYLLSNVFTIFNYVLGAGVFAGLGYIGFLLSKPYWQPLLTKRTEKRALLAEHKAVQARETHIDSELERLKQNL